MALWQVLPRRAVRSFHKTPLITCRCSRHRAVGQQQADWLAAAAQAGDLDRAPRLAADAEATARTITGSGDQAQALTRPAAAIA